MEENITFKEHVTNNFFEIKNKLDKKKCIVDLPFPLRCKNVKGVPTKWAKMEQIETWIGGSLSDMEGGLAKLTIIHYCGDSKEDLIDQLETFIHGLKHNFEYFGS